MDCPPSSSFASDAPYFSHRLDGALCLGEVAHVDPRVSPPTDGGLDVKFASRAVQQVRGQ